MNGQPCRAYVPNQWMFDTVISVPNVPVVTVAIPLTPFSMTDNFGNSTLLNLGQDPSNRPYFKRFVALLQSCQWLMYATAAVWFIMLSAVNICQAQDATLEAVQWRTGRAFDEFAKSPISVSWQHAKLRSHLTHFSRSQQLAIVLDRRVDPNQLLDLTVKNVSIEQFLLRIAQASGTKFCRFGDCYYVGPPENAERLLGINAILTSGRQRKQTVLSRSEPMSWPSLATPQEVLKRLSMENDFEIKAFDRIEHDLMTALDTPPMRLDMRLALLLSQFDCWFKQSEKTKTISIIDPPNDLKASLRMEGYEADNALLQRLRATAPSCKVAKTKRSITITGPTEELEMARNVAIESFEPQERSLDQKRFQLNVKNKRGLILKAVAEQLAMELEVAEDCQDILEDVVAVEVKDATVEMLLDAILVETNCEYALDGQTLRLQRK